MCYYLLNVCPRRECQKSERTTNEVYWCLKALKQKQQCPDEHIHDERLPPVNCLLCSEHSGKPVGRYPWNPWLGSPSERYPDNPHHTPEPIPETEAHSKAKLTSPAPGGVSLPLFGTPSGSSGVGTTSLPPLSMIGTLASLPPPSKSTHQGSEEHEITYDNRIPPPRLTKMPFIPMSESSRRFFGRFGIVHTKRPMSDEYEQRGWVEPEEFGYWRTERSAPGFIGQAPEEEAKEQSYDARAARASQWASDWPAPLPYETLRDFKARQQGLKYFTYALLHPLYEWWAQKDENLQSKTYRQNHKKVGDVWVPK